MKKYTKMFWGFFAVALCLHGLWAGENAKPVPEKMIRNIELFQGSSWDLESGSPSDEEEVKRFLLWSEPQKEAQIHLSSEQRHFDVHIFLVRMMNECRSRESQEYYMARYESTKMRSMDFFNFIVKNVDDDRPVLVLIYSEETKERSLQNVVGYNTSKRQIFFYRRGVLCATEVDKIPQPPSRFYYETTEYFNWHNTCVIN